MTENIFGKQRGRFDERAAMETQRALEAFRAMITQALKELDE